MNDEELKRLWCKQKLDPAKLSPGASLKLMRIKMKLLDRVLFWSDALEIGGAVVGIPLFIWVWYFLKIPLLGRIGIVITIAGEAFIIWKQLRARRVRVSQQPTADAPMMEWLRHELEKVRAECELARTALWWYVLPPWIGMNVFFWGVDIELPARIGCSAVTTAIGVVYWKLNQYTLRKHWPPLKEELEALLRAEEFAATRDDE
jgi:hypothetical protein